MSPLTEPKKKTCGMRSKCGRCANCVRDAWSATWRALSPEDRDWVIAQYLVCAPLGYTERQAKWDAQPSLSRYVLR